MVSPRTIFSFQQEKAAESNRFCASNILTMEFHCNSIVPRMPKNDESPQFSISLPVEAVEMIEEGLVPFGLYGKKRATVCRALILDALKTPAVQEQVRQGREKRAK
jgi:hypothetical protein